MSAGDYFGERALLDNTPRTATVTAAEPTEVLALKKRDFVDFMSRGGRQQTMQRTSRDRSYSVIAGPGDLVEPENTSDSDESE